MSAAPRWAAAAAAAAATTAANSRPDVTLYGGFKTKLKKNNNTALYSCHCIFFLRPQVVIRFHHRHHFPNSCACTHRRCRVSDRVARRLPDLRRAPRLQQVLGESAARLGCHLVIRAATAHPSTCSLLCWQSDRAPRSLSWADRAVFTHARGRAHTHILRLRRRRTRAGGAGCQNGLKLPVVTVKLKHVLLTGDKWGEKECLIYCEREWFFLIFWALRVIFFSSTTKWFPPILQIISNATASCDFMRQS